MLVPSIGDLLHPVDDRRLRQARGLQDRRGDVDDVRELRADSAGLSIPAGQWTIVPLRVPPQWEAICLVHWNGVFMAHAQPTA